MESILLERIFLVQFEWIHLSNCSIRVKENTNRLLGLSKGQSQPQNSLGDH